MPTFTYFFAKIYDRESFTILILAISFQLYSPIKRVEVNTRTLEAKVLVYVFIIYNIINNLITTQLFLYLFSIKNKFTLYYLV